MIVDIMDVPLCLHICYSCTKACWDEDFLTGCSGGGSFPGVLFPSTCKLDRASLQLGTSWNSMKVFAPLCWWMLGKHAVVKKCLLMMSVDSVLFTPR